MRDPDRRPWMPTGPQLLALPLGIQVLISPAGLNHIALDTDAGTWVRLYEDATHERITAGQAAQLRPSDVRTIIQMTTVWAMGRGAGDPDALAALDSLATAVQQLLTFHATRAASRR